MNKLLPLISTALLLIGNVAHPQSSSSTAPSDPSLISFHQKRADQFGKVPLSFELNRGQTDRSVKYLAHGQGYSIFLQPNAATFVLSKPGSRVAADHRNPQAATGGNVLRMNLIGADQNAAMTPENLLPGYSNYLRGNDRSKWLAGVPTFAATRVSKVYQGIDLFYYGTDRQLEYDFVVAPGADVKSIRLTIDGAHAALAPQGELVLQLGKRSNSDDPRFKQPVIYQQIDGRRQPVSGAYTVAANGEVGFSVGPYDHSRELVIDPIVSYGSYFGGSGEDEINGSALNASNQLYIVGQTFSPTLPSDAGEFQSAPTAVNNGHAAFVAKFSADGSAVLWTTYLDGSQDDFATAVAVNASDEAYVVGYTNSCGADNSIPGVAPNTALSFPFTTDAVQKLCSPVNNGAGNLEINGASYDAFLVKLSSDGKSELYGTPLGGSQNDIAQSIVLDATGRPYIVGETSSTQYYKCSAIGPHCGDVPAYPVDNHGNADIGLSNYPTTSNAFYSNTAESQQYATTDPNSGNAGGPQDEQAFITILSADLHSFVYSSLIGGGIIGGCGNGACNTNGYAVAVNASGIAFIGGNTSSAHWPTTSGAFASKCSNAGNANSQCPMTGWLAAFDPTKSGTASLLFSTYMTGSSAGSNSGNPLYPGGDVFGLATDSSGDVIATGDTNANNFPTTTGVFQPACILSGDGNGDQNVCTNAFVTKLTPTGSTVWSTYYHGTGSFGAGNFVIGQGLALDSNNNVFVVGTSNLANLPLKSTLSTNPAQGADAFLIELSSDASQLLMGTYLGAGGGVVVDNNSLHLDSNSNAYFSGYQSYCTNCNQTFPTTANAFAKTGLGGSSDGWVVKMITQQQPSATALAVSATSATPQQTVTFTATVTSKSTLSGIPAPTGSVSFMNGATSLGTGTLNASGVATFAGMLPNATYNVTAVYAGDAAFNTSTSSAVAVSVSASTPTTTTLTASPATLTYGQKATLTATVKAGTAPATSGTVTFTAGSVVLGTATVNAQGVATLSITPPAGIYSIVASYAGTASSSNPGGFGSSSSALTSQAPLTVTKATSTTMLATSSASAATGASVTLTATVTAGATGPVTFLNGTTTLGTGMLNASGTATLATSFPTTGSFSLTAAYGGDTNFNSSTSTALTQVISVASSFAVADAPASLTIVHGSSGSTVITATPTGGFTGTLTFACGTLPTAASCTFAPATLAFTATSAAQTTTLTLNTEASTTSSLRSLPGLSFASQIFAAMLLLPLGLSRRLLRAGKQNSWTRPMLLLAIVVIGAAGFAGMTGCSSGTTGSKSSTPATTPAGTYIVPVNVTSGATTQTLNLQLTVQ
jgi:hypothetical protein